MKGHEPLGRSLLRAALLSAALIGSITFASRPAMADYVQDGPTTTYGDGEKSTWYQDTNDPNKYVIVWERGSQITFIYLNYGSSNGNGPKYGGDPGPDDDGKGTEPINVVATIEHSKIKYQVRANLEDTPFAKWLDRYGGGAAPHWNPGDDGNDSGPATPPVHKNTGPTPLQQAAAARLANLAVAELQGIGTAMGDVDGVVGETGWSIPTTKGNNSRGSGANNSSTNKNNGIRKIFGTDLGPRPDLVNPPHSKAGSKANLLAPSLLDRGSTFSARGPSAAGSMLPGGSGSITRSGPSAAGVR